MSLPQKTAPRRARRTKGEQTRGAIVQAAIEQAASQGLEGLTIGSLAERTGLSKSGLFAHFGSREELQMAVLHAYEQRFLAQVLRPALEAPRGLPRLRAICRLWLRQMAAEADSGCIMVSGAAEYDDRPGPLRDELVAMVQRWQGELARAVGQAVSEKHLPQGMDIAAFVFETYGIVLAMHHEARLLRNPRALERATQAFERLLEFQLSRQAA
ncbi:MAG: TetR/AcrR family transcriptional regulator [Burkholderiaceae bacterium]